MFNAIIKKRGLLSVVLVSFLLYLPACSHKVEPPDNKLDELIAIGDSYYKEGEYYKSLDYYLMALDIAPDNYLLHYKIGLLYGTMHSQNLDRSEVIGKKYRTDRERLSEDSFYEKSLQHFQKAADLGHAPSKENLRAMRQNIQHKDVKY